MKKFLTHKNTYIHAFHFTREEVIRALADVISNSTLSIDKSVGLNQIDIAFPDEQDSAVVLTYTTTGEVKMSLNLERVNLERVGDKL